MFSKVKSTSLLGINALPVFVEAQITSGLKRFAVVGLPDGIVKEARDRVRCAIENSGFTFPYRDVVVSLSPASLPKSGSAFDLAIALSILAADNQIDPKGLERCYVLGELALDGSIRPVRGVLASAEHVRQREDHAFLIPRRNAAEVSLIKGVTAIPLTSLAEAVSYLNGTREIEPAISSNHNNPHTDHVHTFSDVIGQFSAKRAAELVAAGAHNLLMVGPPGVGKSMIAARIPSIVPELSEPEAIEVSKIYSAFHGEHSGVSAVPRFDRLRFQRPVRMPHHSTSTAALIGGGPLPRPGEISLAHRGILFLDELTEFRRDALEALRQPLEEKFVTISRAKLSLVYPASFVLVGAMNPCPCGKRGIGTECDCSAQRLARYHSKVSGPIMDRIDIQVWVPPVPVDQLGEPLAKDPTTEMRKRVALAREIQRKRFKSTERLNAHMTASEIKQFCKTTESAYSTLQLAAEKHKLSARGYAKVLRVARTIADFLGAKEIDSDHICEALSYRMERL